MQRSAHNKSSHPAAGFTPAIAIDIGGTKIQAGLVDNRGATHLIRRIATPHGMDGEALFHAVLGLVHDLVARAHGVGVACPGPMEASSGVVSPLHIAAWRDFPLGRRLEDALSLPVAIDNDAKAAVLGELWTGSLRGSLSAMCVVVSTGVGSGIVLDGRLLDGVGGNAGHIGHVRSVPSGAACPCGGTGCLEAEISGLALARQAGHAPPYDHELLSRAGTLLGRAVVDVATLLDLDCVAVGGGVALESGPQLLAATRTVVRDTFTLYHRPLRLFAASAHPLVGAAAVLANALYPADLRMIFTSVGPDATGRPG